MSVTIIKDLARAVREAREPMSIGRLANDSKALNYRHPDSALISYPKVVNAGPIGALRESGTPLNIAIVGAGPGGVAALYELGRMATSSRPVHVTLYESDPDNFAVQRNSNSRPKALVRRRAGRVSSYSASDNTVYEIGAMRFPTIAGLTWHYAQAVFGDEPMCQQFPNPGTVPTEFVFGSQFDRYVGNEWLNPASPTKRVKELVLRGLYGAPYPELIHLAPVYRIGARTGLDANELLVDPDTPDSELQEFTTDWNEFIEQHDGTSLEGAVRHILTQYSTSLPSVAGLTGKQLISWCVELFGRFGFGTGGFKPLFNMSLVEMMRLMLWDYSNEYTFPTSEVKGNVQFVEAIYDKAIENEFLTVDVVHARVSDVFQSGAAQDLAARIAFYRPNSRTAIEFGTHDYGVLALPHDAAAQLVARIGYGTGLYINYEVGDFGAASIPTAPPTVRPALQVSTTAGQNAVNARMISAISTMHMTRSSKVFGTITDANASGPDVPEFPTGSGNKISAIVSDSGLAATYMVPSTLNPAYRSFLVSYSWDDDSTRLQNAFSTWPENDSNARPEDSSMYDAMLNRAYRVSPDPASVPSSNPPKWWLSATLNQVQDADKVAFDWTTYTTAGGFKLDATGDNYQSSLCFRYHTHANVEGLYNRFFLAGDSFSHLGGWLEGAFMSAINAVAGITLADNAKNLSTLNQEARKLFTTLTPVVPMN
ncbi:tryptophan 2-monooxygenase oxidoreductase [Paraburkholderia sediminicola]|uniref:tryptophan 2-monooxygenase oxidoreductase n=1 Tax=Paraburkholderia sediminicola TaxID=458836 RepID=UPI0038B7DCFF